MTTSYTTSPASAVVSFSSRQSGTGRVVAILMAFCEEPEENVSLTVSEVARRVGRERSQVSRMMKVLAEEGFLERDAETLRYGLGWRAALLGRRAGDQVLLTAGRRVTRRLATATGESSKLSVLQGNRALTILRARSPQSLQAGGWPGSLSPLHATAAGRILMFDMGSDEVQQLVGDDFGATDLGPRAPQNMRGLKQKLARERRLGYAVAADELEVGLTSLGAPVRTFNDSVVASLNVSGPTQRIRGREAGIGQLLTEVATHVRGALRSGGISRL